MVESPTPKPSLAGAAVAYSLNVEELYGFGKDPPMPKELSVQGVHWTNHSFVFVMGQDVVIDFVQAPGSFKEGKQIVPAVRITMNRVVAKRLAETIQQNLEQARQQALAAKQAKGSSPGQTPTQSDSTAVASKGGP